MSSLTYDEAVAYMSSLLRFGWKLGNDRFFALLSLLGDPHLRFRVLHVAGTKGKGSTTALAAAVLRHSGWRVGAYFSPYVYDLRERIQVDGEVISHEDFARLVTAIRPHAEALARTEHGETTEFELKTAVAFAYFAERRVDAACVEVGIGGRIDATNVVQPTVTVITNIGLDHTQILGDTHAKIAAEKAGIIKPGVCCITAVDHTEALPVIEQTASDFAAPLVYVRRGSAGAPTGRADTVRWDVEATSSPDFAPVTIATQDAVYAGCDVRMGGLYQRGNAACAAVAVERMLQAEGRRLDLASVRRGLAETTLPGRFTVIAGPGAPLVVLDGAHNGIAAEALVGPLAALGAAHGVQRTLMVVGMVGGHALDDVLGVLAPLAATVYACAPEWRRAVPAGEVAAAARHWCADVRIAPTVREAVASALRDSSPTDMVLVTGSFYTVGEAPLALFTAGALSP